MKLFRYRGRLYIRCIPGKRLFNSTLVHEVVNRGDVFAMEVDSQQLTIIPGIATIEHVEGSIVISNKDTKALPTLAEEAEAFLQAVNARTRAKILADEMRAMLTRGIGSCYD